MSSADQYTPQDPTTQHTASDDLPGHKIHHPGLEFDMEVEPDFGEWPAEQVERTRSRR
jgi:hypothetical protein